MRRHLVWYITVNVSEEYTASIFGVDMLEMETVHSSKTLITIYRTTRRHMPNDSNLHSGQSENQFSVISMARLSIYRWVSLPHKSKRCKLDRKNCENMFCKSVCVLSAYPLWHGPLSASLSI
jgi:hypothetical protein